MKDIEAPVGCRADQRCRLGAGDETSALMPRHSPAMKVAHLAASLLEEIKSAG
jgi:hypothetical protein